MACNLAGIEIDRKVLADIAVNDAAAFGVIANRRKPAQRQPDAAKAGCVEWGRSAVAR